MSLGADVMEDWWYSHENTRYNKEVSWQPCEREPALRADTNLHCHSEGTSV